MAAYALAHIRHITIGPAIAEYLQKIDATLTPFEGRFLVHGGPIEVLEGALEGHVIIIEFRSLDTARAWYRSPPYQAILRLRTDNSEGTVILVDGVAAGHRATDVLGGESK
jgi:uncharacterized protein (DUF1330 family)